MQPIVRIAESQIKYGSFKDKNLFISGSYRVGKTTLVKQLFPESTDIAWINARDVSHQLLIEKQDIKKFQAIINNQKIVVIDEIEHIKNLQSNLAWILTLLQNKRIIITSSVSLTYLNEIVDKVNLNISAFNLHPLSLAEMYHNQPLNVIKEKLPFHLIYGLYPEVCIDFKSTQKHLKHIAGHYLYRNTLAVKDIRKPTTIDKLLKLLSKEIGNELAIYQLAKKLKLKSETVESYIRLLEEAHIIFRLQTYFTNPKKEATKISKVYFWDNGVRNAIAGDFRTLNKRNDVNQLWENFMLSERMKMNRLFNHERKPYFWHNYNKRKVSYLELYKNNISAFDFCWDSKESKQVSTSFLNQYPHATTDVITPNSFSYFCGIG